ncbi:MAG: hypothetical protein ACREJ4_03155 [Candidatus Methylomirabilaceae bacterium]
MSKLKLICVFRRPRWPVLCEVPGDLVAAYSLGQLERRLSKFQLPLDTVLHMIDATGEGWGLYTELAAVSPLVLKKRWTKAELLELYRGSATGRRVGTRSTDKALFRQRLGTLILLIADLINQGSRFNERAVPRAGSFSRASSGRSGRRGQRGAQHHV